MEELIGGNSLISSNCGGTGLKMGEWRKKKHLKNEGGIQLLYN